LTPENVRYGVLGEHYRFFGSLEAIEEDEIVWLFGDGLRIPVFLDKVEVFFLSSETTPRQVEWNHIGNLAEGTQFFVFGTMILHSGRMVLGSGTSDELLAVMYEGHPSRFVSWAIQSGRQQNEFWNFLTPVSLMVGSLSYLILTLGLGEYPIQRFWLAVSLLGALLPVLPLFPPGIGFYALYRRFWKKGRTFRVDRDVLSLPLLYFLPPDINSTEGGYRIVKHLQTGDKSFPERVLLPDGQPYGRIAVTQEVFEGLGAQLRTSRVNESLGPHRKPNDLPVTVFGSPSNGLFEGYLIPPQDPMAEFLGIPGEVGEKIVDCQKKAMKYEFYSVAFFGASYGVNSVLIGWIIWQILRIIR